MHTFKIIVYVYLRLGFPKRGDQRESVITE